MLLGLGYVVVELADQTLAEQDVGGGQMMVELAMSVFHTAAAMAPDLQTSIAQARRRLNATSAAIRDRLPSPDEAAPDEQWPCRTR